MRQLIQRQEWMVRRDGGRPFRGTGRELDGAGCAVSLVRRLRISRRPRTAIRRLWQNIQQASTQNMAAIRQVERAAQDLNELARRLTALIAASGYERR